MADARWKFLRSVVAVFGVMATPFRVAVGRMSADKSSKGLTPDELDELDDFVLATLKKFKRKSWLDLSLGLPEEEQEES